MIYEFALKPSLKNLHYYLWTLFITFLAKYAFELTNSFQNLPYKICIRIYEFILKSSLQKTGGKVQPFKSGSGRDQEIKIWRYCEIRSYWFEKEWRSDQVFLIFRDQEDQDQVGSGNQTSRLYSGAKNLDYLKTFWDL